jgi:hypothetical protein
MSILVSVTLVTLVEMLYASVTVSESKDLLSLLDTAGEINVTSNNVLDLKLKIVCSVV